MLLLHRENHKRQISHMVLLVKSLDELWEGKFPLLLVVIVYLAELLRVHPEFTRHLHLGVAQPMALASIDPHLEFGRQFLRLVLLQGIPAVQSI